MLILKCILFENIKYKLFWGGYTMPINIINSNERYKADAIIRPFCDDNDFQLVREPQIKKTNPKEFLWSYEIKAYYPISCLLKNYDEETKYTFRNRCLECLEAAKRRDCEKVIIDLNTNNDYSEIHKIVFDEAMKAAELFLSANEMTVMLSVSNDSHLLSEPDLFHDVSHYIEEQINRQYEQAKLMACAPDPTYKSSDFHESDGADEDCFGTFHSPKHNNIDCFGARDFEEVCENEDICFLTDFDELDADGFSFCDIEPIKTEPKYEDSDIVFLNKTDLNKKLSEEEINAVTEALMHILKPNETFTNKLLRLIDSKGMDYVDCYRKANVSRQLWSQITNNSSYRPSKKTVLSFAFALELTLDETQALLKSVGLILSESLYFDLIIMFFLERRIYNIHTLNTILYDLRQDTLYC